MGIRNLEVCSLHAEGFEGSSAPEDQFQTVPVYEIGLQECKNRILRNTQAQQASRKVLKKPAKEAVTGPKSLSVGDVARIHATGMDPIVTKGFRQYIRPADSNGLRENEIVEEGKFSRYWQHLGDYRGA